ncbi:hypothetical protein JB92DRAFT_284365 [Gautieria morchelliformis]|nr:hypothetical protein JB92DRAFT_284365 [Gautieria morchelliformis]
MSSSDLSSYQTYETPLSMQSISEQRKGAFVLSSGVFTELGRVKAQSLKLGFQQMRFYTWRKLWFHLAITEKELGLPISDQAIAEMQAKLFRPQLFHLFDTKY